MGRGEGTLELQELLEIAESERARSAHRPLKELNHGDPAERLARARELTDPREIFDMWATNQNSSKILRALCSRPAISSDNKKAAIKRLKELTDGDFGPGKMDRARGIIEGLVVNPSLSSDDADQLISALSHLDDSLDRSKVGNSQFYRADRLSRALKDGLAFHHPSISEATRVRLMSESVFRDGAVRTISNPKTDHATRNDLAHQAEAIGLAGRSTLTGEPREQMIRALLRFDRVPEACEVLKRSVAHGAVKKTHVRVRSNLGRDGTILRGSHPRVVASNLGMRRTRAITAEIMAISEGGIRLAAPARAG